LRRCGAPSGLAPKLTTITGHTTTHEFFGMAAVVPEAKQALAGRKLQSAL